MPNTNPPRETPAALATEAAGFTVVMGMAMVGPVVIEPGVDDAVIEGPTVAEETVFDDPMADITVARFELDNWVVPELKPDTVPFNDRDVPAIADADDPVL